MLGWRGPGRGGGGRGGGGGAGGGGGVWGALGGALGAGGRLRREADPLYRAAPGGFGQAVAAIAELERETLGNPGIRGAVLRYGFFYGPGTSYAAGGSIAGDVRRRRFPVLGDGAGVFCFIHVQDAAPAPLPAIHQRAGGRLPLVRQEP